VDALFFTGVRSRAELDAIAAATTLPIILGGVTEALADGSYLGARRVRIAVQGHAPISAAIQAIYTTLKAIREGAAPKDLTGLASPELITRLTREAEVKAMSARFLMPNQADE